MHPPKLIYLLPYDKSLHLNCSANGSQVATFLGLPPIGRPKYIKGTAPFRQFKKEHAISIKSEATFRPIKQLLWKFTLSPETISKPLNNTFKVHKFSTLASSIQRVSSSYWRCESVTPPLYFKTFKQISFHRILHQTTKPPPPLKEKETVLKDRLITSPFKYWSLPYYKFIMNEMYDPNYIFIRHMTKRSYSFFISKT